MNKKVNLAEWSFQRLKSRTAPYDMSCISVYTRYEYSWVNSDEIMRLFTFLTPILAMTWLASSVIVSINTSFWKRYAITSRRKIPNGSPSHWTLSVLFLSLLLRRVLRSDNLYIACSLWWCSFCCEIPSPFWMGNIQLWTFYSVNMVWYLLNFTVLTEAEPRSILSNSVNIRPYLLSKMSITVLLYS